MPRDTQPRPNVMTDVQALNGSAVPTRGAIDPDSKRTTRPDSPALGGAFHFHREIIVRGEDVLSKTIAEELRGAGARIIKINAAADLLGAGVHRARAVVCAGPNDAMNLEIALLA